MQTFEGDFFACIVRHLVAPAWAAREKSPYLQHLRRLPQAHARSPEQVRTDNLRRLRELLRHAGTQTDFYAERLQGCGLRPDDIRSIDDLARLPTLTKNDIRMHRDRMVARNLPRRCLVPGKTSGSTGVSLEFFVDEDSQQWKRACALYYNEWTGWRFGERVGAVWGNPKTRQGWRMVMRNLLLERFIYLDTLKMDEAAMEHFYRRLLRFRPPLLFGHAHSLFLFARFLRSRGFTGLRPKGIISTAMVLHDFERREIEEILGCPVTNRYGCEEVSLIACECRKHRGLHLNLDTLIVEFIRDGRPAEPGEPGAIVVTDLTNYGMPFIRYQIGDVGIPSARSCPCGCPYPLMESLEGRSADYVVTPEGHYVSGISLTENFAMHLPGVKQMQIVQEKIDFLIFRLVPAAGARPEEIGTEVAALARKRFGATMRFQVDFVDAIPQEASGKYRFCISRLPNPFSAPT